MTCTDTLLSAGHVLMMYSTEGIFVARETKTLSVSEVIKIALPSRIRDRRVHSPFRLTIDGGFGALKKASSTASIEVVDD